VVGANSETDFIIYSRPRSSSVKKKKKEKRKRKGALFNCKYDNREIKMFTSLLNFGKYKKEA
jgi:hypothetical protein